MIFFDEGSEFIAPRAREKMRERATLLLTTTVDSVQLWPLEQGRSKFSDSSYIDKQEPFHLCHSEGLTPLSIVLPEHLASGFTQENPAALMHPGSF